MFKFFGCCFNLKSRLCSFRWQFQRFKKREDNKIQNLENQIPVIHQESFLLTLKQLIGHGQELLKEDLRSSMNPGG